jgi:hypothetical protein
LGLDRAALSADLVQRIALTELADRLASMVASGRTA